MDAGRRAADLLERRPELEDALRAVLDVDAERGGWTFDDVPVDSGAFGELVSAGIVEDDDGGGYRVADPAAVHGALEVDGVGAHPEANGPEIGARLRASAAHIDGRALGLLVASLAFFAVVRSYALGAVFRDRLVVLSGNDPYYYRYLVEQVMETGGSGLTLLGNLPGGAKAGEPLFVGSLSVVTEIFGGIQASGLVLAMYPLVAGLVAAVLLYLMAVWVTDDRRVGLAAVLLLSIVPGHAFRTSVGYADHHAFDYVWLVLTALALVALIARDERPSLGRASTWLAIGGLALGVTGQTLAWEGGPLLVLPVAFVVVAQGLLAVRDERSPMADLAAPVVGLWLAAVATFATHVLLDWHGTSVAIAPLLVALGATGVAVTSEGAKRAGRTARELLAFESVVGAVGAVGAWFVVPDFLPVLVRVFGQVTRTGTTAEARAFFDAATLGFILVFGPVLLVLAGAFLLWGTVRVVDTDESLLVPCTYAWFFLALTLYQVRFVGELAPFLALFGGLGFVWLAAWVDLAALPVPFTADDAGRDWLPERPAPRTAGYLLALFLLVGGVGLVQSAVKIDQVAISDPAYETAAWIDDYAEERGWDSLEDGYVFSRWDSNRLFNYFATGDSEDYTYAQSAFPEFLVETDPEAAYASVRDRVALIVLSPRSGDPPTMQALLHERYGSDGGSTSGTGHFRARFVGDAGEFKVFEPVDGAVLTGQVAPNASVRALTDVTIPGATFTYERTGTANATGRFSIRVAYEGTYSVEVDGQTQSVDVSDSAVEAGERIRVGT